MVNGGLRVIDSEREFKRLSLSAKSFQAIKLTVDPPRDARVAWVMRLANGWCEVLKIREIGN